MLLPFVILWPISVVVVYHIALVLANQPYDAALAESVRAVSRQVQPVGDGLRVDFPVPPQTLLRADGDDAIYYQVLGPKREVISGEREFPLGPLPAPVRSGEVYFRHDVIAGRDVRVAFQFVRLEAEPPQWVQVQVAETLNKRTALAYRMVAGVLIPQLAMLPLAVLLVRLGLRRGLSPLGQLQKRMRRRRPHDLSPLDPSRAPSELRPLLNAFNTMLAQLSSSMDAQQRFVADAAHQLRTPLAGLKMQVELAQNEQDPAQLAKWLPVLAVSINRTCHLVNQLLMLARAESAIGDPLSRKRVDLEALIAQVAGAMVPQARAKSIDLEFERPPFPLATAGEPALLAEVIKNLLDNAIKYTPPQGRVTVRLYAESQAVIEVQDSGIGIPQSEREHVFDRFYRVLGTGAEGSGLGLAIAKEIIARHAGIISLADPPNGQGCVMQVRLPLVALQVVSPAALMHSGSAVANTTEALERSVG
jgi:two-component system sensor histidine kinase TctE